MASGFLSSFGLDPRLEADMRADGYVFNAAAVEKSRQTFAPTKDLSLPAGWSRHDDVAYGPLDRHRLDICGQEGAKKPVVLYVPGGGFVGGDKKFYDHMSPCFARLGFVGVTMNYRLAPNHLFPAGAEDVAAALDWIAENIAKYGGDGGKLFVIGQSAGAVHAASTLFDPRFRPKRHADIRGAALMSGLYKIRADMVAPNANLYFGNDPDQCADRSSVNYVETTSIPVLMTHAELEPVFFGEQTASLFDALNRRDGHAPLLAMLKGHNHLSPVLGMGSKTDLLGPAILAEFRSRL